MGVPNMGYGVDALRTWVASVDYTKDVSIGPDILSKWMLRGASNQAYRRTSVVKSNQIAEYCKILIGEPLRF